MADGVDMRAFNQQVIERFRADGGIGKVGPVDLEHLVLLTTTGRRSGQQRTVPLGFTEDDAAALLLFASNMGAPKHPDWYRNIESNTHVRVEVTGAAWETEAEVLAGAERDDAYRRWVEMSPSIADHQEKAGRQIPMVRVRRV